MLGKHESKSGSNIDDGEAKVIDLKHLADFTEEVRTPALFETGVNQSKIEELNGKLRLVMTAKMLHGVHDSTTHAVELSIALRKIDRRQERCEVMLLESLARLTGEPGRMLQNRSRTVLSLESFRKNG